MKDLTSLHPAPGLRPLEGGGDAVGNAGRRAGCRFSKLDAEDVLDAGRRNIGANAAQLEPGGVR